MATGDLNVRKHVGSAGFLFAGGTTTARFDTLIKQVGTSITYDASVGEFTCTDAGRYFVSFSEHWGSSTLSERLNFGSWIQVNRLDPPYHGFATGYARGNGGSLSDIASGSAILNLTANDVVTIRSARIDDSVAVGSSARMMTPGASVSILKLGDDQSFGMFSGPATATATVQDALTPLALSDTPVTGGATFTRDGDEITITSQNPVLFAYSTRSTDHAATKSRSNYQTLLTRRNFPTSIPLSYDGCYIRGNENTLWGGTSSSGILAPEVDQPGTRAVSLRVISRANGGDSFTGRLQLFELPVTAKAVIVEPATGTTTNVNTTGVLLPWGAPPVYANPVYTFPSIFSAGAGAINARSDGDYLAFASQAKVHAGISSVRGVPGIEFQATGLSSGAIATSSYDRGTGTSTFPTMSMSGILTDQISGGELGVLTHSLNVFVPEPILIGGGGFALLELASLLPDAGRVVDSRSRSFGLAAARAALEAIKPSTVTASGAGVATGTAVGIPHRAMTAVARSIAVAAGRVAGLKRIPSAAIARGSGVVSGLAGAVPRRVIPTTARAVALIGSRTMAEARLTLRTLASGATVVTSTVTARRGVINRIAARVRSGHLAGTTAAATTTRPGAAEGHTIDGASAAVTSTKGGTGRLPQLGAALAAFTSRRRGVARVGTVLSGVAAASPTRLARIRATSGAIAAGLAEATSKKTVTVFAASVVGGWGRVATSRPVRAVAAGVTVTGSTVATTSRNAAAHVGAGLVGFATSASRTVAPIRSFIVKVRSRFNDLKVR